MILLFESMLCLLIIAQPLEANIPARGGCAPPTITNGRYFPDATRRSIAVETVVTFSCFEGFLLNGINSAICNNDGTWSNAFPTCNKRAICTRPVLPHGSFYPLLPTFIPYDSGMSVDFNCDTGFVLKGASTVRCQESGEWDEELPMCHSLSDSSTGCDPPVLDNGSIYPPAGYGSIYYNVGSVITYKCNNDFFLMGWNSAICLEGGEWSSEPPQCEVTCERPTLNNGRMIPDIPEYPYVAGMTVTYYCDTGFLLLGQQTSNCMKTGQWTSSTPRCQRPIPLAPPINFEMIGRCRLVEFLHGKVKPELPPGLTDYAPNAIVEFSCVSGRVLVGSPLVECTLNNEWSDPIPSCEVGCQNPIIDNGRVQPTFDSFDEYFAPGLTAIITCNSGFVLVGEPTVVCQNDGTWSRRFPTCAASRAEIIDNPSIRETRPSRVEITPVNNGEDVICPKPIIKYGILISDDDLLELMVGSKVYFGCHVGYVLRGVSSITCLEGGIWNSELPTCVVGCQTPYLESGHVTPDMSFSGDYFRPSMDASFICIRGFRLSGNGVISCQQNGTWNRDPPTCIPQSDSDLYSTNVNMVQCSSPTISHASYEPEMESYTADTLITVTCNAGYRTDDVLTSKCLQSGEWSTLPSCERGCRSPEFSDIMKPMLPHGETLFAIGKEVKFSCNSGSDLDGAKSLICQSSGNWNGDVPTCKVKCSHPVLENGSFQPRKRRRGYAHGTVVTFRCDDGYFIHGSITATCMNGAWESEEDTTCNLIATRVTTTTTQIPTTRFRIPTTTPLTPKTFVSSTTTGTTTRKPTTFAPTTKRYTTTQKPQTHRPTTKQYHTTRHQYTTTRAPNTYPTKSQSTSPSSGCIVPSITNGVVVRYTPGREVEMGVTVVSVCNSGYIVRGSANVKCGSSGRWLTDFPECSRYIGFCAKPSELKMGRFVPLQKQYRVGQKINFFCNSGTRMVGSRVAYCQGSGKFTSFPRCEPSRGGASKSTISNKQIGTVTLTRNQCAPPELPERVSIEPTRAIYSAGDAIQYRCASGYKLYGATRAYCKAVYGFFPKPPRCEPIQCVAPRIPANGHIINQKKTYHYGDKLQYGCLKNYVIVGYQENECMSTGEYKHKVSDCRPPSCREECNFVRGRSCQCDIKCRWVKGSCCSDFDQYCRKLYYK